jgi:hypothetical protein
LAEQAFEEYLTGFVDKSSGLDVGPFIKRINEVAGSCMPTGS